MLHKAQLQQLPHLETMGVPWRMSKQSTRAVLTKVAFIKVPMGVYNSKNTCEEYLCDCHGHQANNLFSVQVLTHI